MEQLRTTPRLLKPPIRTIAASLCHGSAASANRALRRGRLGTLLLMSPAIKEKQPAKNMYWDSISLRGYRESIKLPYFPWCCLLLAANRSLWDCVDSRFSNLCTRNVYFTLLPSQQRPSTDCFASYHAGRPKTFRRVPMMIFISKLPASERTDG